MNSVVISCEHAGNSVPEKYKHLFKNAGEVLESHRGWDPGAIQLAKYIANHVNSPLFSCLITRLLIEPNRSLDNDQLFSEFSNKLTSDEKRVLIEEFYKPYRNRIEAEIEASKRPANHFSIHTFTPVLHGKVRTTDIGLLFDPDRKGEVILCSEMKKELEVNLPTLSIDFNQPYKGIEDGLTTYLRKKFPDDHYRGIEIEVNQKFLNSETFEKIQAVLEDAILKVS